MHRASVDFSGLFSAGRRWAVLGIGHPDRADDAFGPRFAGLLTDAGWTDAIAAQTSPEGETFRLVGRGYTDVLLVDAVEMSASPGSSALIPSSALEKKFPQVSTHRISLGLLSRYLVERLECRVWLLGCQPACTALGAPMSPEVSEACRLLAASLLRAASAPTHEGAACI